jgi:nitrogen-specific signal transduction histidine kinase
MSSEDLIHSINNQLAVVMGKADLLGQAVSNSASKETCLEIKAAAMKINKLIHEYNRQVAP